MLADARQALNSHFASASYLCDGVSAPSVLFEVFLLLITCEVSATKEDFDLWNEALTKGFMALTAWCSDVFGMSLWLWLG